MSESRDKDDLRQIVDNFAADGLRTLLFAYKKISLSEYKDFETSLELAKQSIVNRQKFVREAYKSMERGFQLLGVTAIEDKLQV